MELAHTTPTARAALFHAVLVGAVAVVKSAANALFIANLPASWLASLYVVVAAVVTVVTVLLAGPLARRAPGQLLRVSAWSLAALVVGLGVAARAGAQPLVLASLYVAAEVYATVLSVLFWTTISTWFDARAARDSYAIISAGGMAGSMVGGVLVRALVSLAGSGGAAAIACVLPLFALPLLRGAGGEALRPSGAKMQTGASYLRHRPYPRYVAAFGLLSAMVAACVDFVFRVQASSRLDETQLATLFGDLNAVIGAVTIAYQIFLTRTVLRRGGLFVFLSIVPVLLFFVSSVAGATSAFGLIVVMKGLEMAGSYSIQQAGVQLLYNPIPNEARAAVRAFVDGLVRKVGLAVSGVLLVIVAESAPSAISPWLVAALTVCSLLLLRFVRAGYLRALEEKLRGSRALVVVPTVEVGDRATRKLLLETLASPRGADVLTALALLERDPDFDPEPHLEHLLTHDDARVRLRALELVPTHVSPAFEVALVSLLALGEQRPRAAAARAVARVRPERAAARLSPYLADPDVGVVRAVVAALHPLPETRAAASERFLALIASAPDQAPQTRTEIAGLLGELPLEQVEPHFAPFLDDASADVRTATLASAATLFESERTRGTSLETLLPLVRLVRARLASRVDRDHAREALVRLGDLVVPVLRRNLNERHLPLGVRIELPRLLAQIGTADAAEALLFSNIKDDPSLRYRIAESLFRLKRQHPDVPMDRARAEEACRRRLKALTHYRPMCHALWHATSRVPREGHALRAWDALRRITRDRLTQNLETALHLLGLHHGAERMDRVARQLVIAESAALHGATALEVQGLRADAIEVLDVALSGDALHGPVLRALEPPPTAHPADARWRDALRTAAALRTSHDPMISALARRVLATAPEQSDVSAVTDILMAASWEAFQPGDPTINDPTDYEELPEMDERLVTRVLALEQVDLFAGLSVDDVTAIAGIAEELHTNPGDVLYRQGEPGDTLFVIVEGRVRLEESGRHLLVHGAGETFGQVSFLDRGPRPTTAIVTDDPGGAELIVINNEAFMDLVIDRPALTRGLFAVLGQRLRLLIELQGGREQRPGSR